MWHYLMWVFNCCFLHGIFSDLFLPTILIELKFLCKGNILTTWWPHVGMDLWIKDTTQTCALGINNNILTGIEFGIRVQHKDITCGWFCQQNRERQPEMNTEGFGKRPALKKKKKKNQRWTKKSKSDCQGQKITGPAQSSSEQVHWRSLAAEGQR